MVLLKIISEKNDIYELKRNNSLSPVYELIIDFYGIEKPVVGDTIFIHENLLDKKYEGYAQPYSFEFEIECDENKKTSINDTEHIVLNNSKKSVIMKRIYG